MNIADKIHLIDDLVEWVTENVAKGRFDEMSKKMSESSTL